jgi:hypothetical protein
LEQRLEWDSNARPNSERITSKPEVENSMARRSCNEPAG